MHETEASHCSNHQSPQLRREALKNPEPTQAAKDGSFTRTKDRLESGEDANDAVSNHMKECVAVKSSVRTTPI